VVTHPGEFDPISFFGLLKIINSHFQLIIIEYFCVVPIDTTEPFNTSIEALFRVIRTHVEFGAIWQCELRVYMTTYSATSSAQVVVFNMTEYFLIWGLVVDRAVVEGKLARV
jgi:hypothetical protein